MGQRILVLGGATLGLWLSLGLGVVLAEETPKERAIKYRQSAMTLVGSNFKPMGDMLKGEIPYDREAFARYAADLGAVASIDILRGFPEDSEGEGSKAKGEIWLSWDTFSERLEAFKTETAKLAEVVAAGGDSGAIKQQFSATAKTCKNCHDDFKE